MAFIQQENIQKEQIEPGRKIYLGYTDKLMMGMTTLEQGAVWNTMPVHTHKWRMEAYISPS